MLGPEVFLILIGWAVAAGTPGPATLAISGAAMNGGRAAGLAMASGVVVGSASWGIAAALGMSALMLTNAWAFEVIRYVGAAYLLWLAFKSLKSAIKGSSVNAATVSIERLFIKGFLIHITNPKAILAWGSIYAIALPPSAGTTQIWQLFLILIITSMSIFGGYGVLFSNSKIVRGYAAAKRWFDATFAILFGVASFKILTVKV